jgi:hypothetical protein
VNGPGAVAHRRMFAFAGVERRFLLGGFIIGLVPMILAIVMVWCSFTVASTLGITFRPRSAAVIVFASAIGAMAMIAVFFLYARLS